MAAGSFTVGDVKIVQESEKAFRVTGADHSGWVPKSVIHDDSEVSELGDEGSLVVQYWWAKESGFT